MKERLIVFLLFWQMIGISFAQNDSIPENIIFFYNANLTNQKDININGIDLDFHINTYKILEQNGYIDSLFVRDNENQIAQIDSNNWVYSCEFKVDKHQLKEPVAMLNLENVDGNCTVVINKKKIAYLNNSFLTYHIDVKKYLKKGKNKIEFRFCPKNSNRVLQRCPQYLYGWDWFPKMLAPRVGSIYLSFENDLPVIEYASIQTLSIDTISQKASLQLNIHFRNPLKQEHELILQNTPFDFAFSVNYPFNQKYNLKPNKDGNYQLNLTIDKPKLWWPNNLGNQNLYCVSLFLDNTVNSLYTTYFGIRTIKLNREKDKWGESFYFSINDKPFFAKGANYIMTYDNVESDITQCVAANFNMLRIWGGSDYGSEEFYNLCDRFGIIVWQDYPFACEMYPLSAELLESINKEVEQNLLRINAHPSLGLLCGNNEIWEGWQHWGWKEQINDTLTALRDYEILFKEQLPYLTKKYAPTIDYIHSSPLYHGWGNSLSLQRGDCHYWGVWWGDSTFSTYTHKVPRFMSEFGFQGAMNLETAQKYCSLPYEQQNNEFAIHEKHDRGFSLINSRLKELMPDIVSSEQYITYSQHLQQIALKTAVETYRIHKPYCMGSLFWQFNEPYPCIGWGCLDYSSTPKPAYYTAMQVYKPLIFAIESSQNDCLNIYACSDLLSDTIVNYSIKVMNQKDIVIFDNTNKQKLIPAGKTILLATINIKDIKQFNKSDDYLIVEGFYGDELISNYHFFVKPKEFTSIQKYFEIIYKYYFDEPADESEEEE